MGKTIISRFQEWPAVLEALGKVFLVVAVFLSVSAYGFAQSEDDGDLLYVYTKTSDEAAKYDIEDLNKITFGEKGVQLWNTSWPTEYPYAKVSVLSFKDRSSRPTGIKKPTADNSRISIAYDASGSKVTVRSSVPLTAVSVFNTQGVVVFSDSRESQSYDISLKELPCGVYVVKAQGTQASATRKIVRR